MPVTSERGARATLWLISAAIDTLAARKNTMSHAVRARLSVMMFLQYFIWGAWYVTMGTYLLSQGFSGVQVGSAYSTVAWGALLAPLIVGMIADRLFAAQKVLGVLHLLGAGLLFAASRVTDPGALFWVLLAYALAYAPTLGVANTVAFCQMADPAREFPRVRVLGTLGWIVAGWLVSLLGIESTAQPMVIAAGASVALGLYAFSLPAVPPRAEEHNSLKTALGLDALALLKDRSFAVLVASSLLISIPLAFYYNFTNAFLNEVGVPNAAGTMAYGQASEVAFMVLMPILLGRFGIKKVMLAGMLAWSARYVLFTVGGGSQPPLQLALYAAILLHGICYDFFFVSGQIYVDKKAPAALRASAQAFLTLVTYGVGMLIGSKVSGFVVDQHARRAGDETVHDWSLWYVPAIAAAGVALVFALSFRDDAPPSDGTGRSDPATARRCARPRSRR